jgi:hypothetical protein
MPKYVYVYINAENWGQVVESMTQLANLTDMSYRTLQRRMKGGFYINPLGRFSVYKLEYLRDSRTNNGDPDIKTKYKPNN